MGLDTWLPQFITTSEIKGICENFLHRYCKEPSFPMEIELIVEKGAQSSNHSYRWNQISNRY